MSKAYRGSGGGKIGRRFQGNVASYPLAGPFAVLLIVVICALSFGLVSCRSRSASGPDLGGETDTDSILPSVYMAASIIQDRGELEKIFKTFPPDSGVVPLEVTIRNWTERPLLIHTSHGLGAPESFHGFTLETGGEEYIPLAPIDALAILMGVRELPRYHKPGIFDAVVSIAVPPAILVYGRREMSVGRRYRSLFKHSIYEATNGNAVEPMRVEAGEEAKGFLFFYMPPDANLYLAGNAGPSAVDSAGAETLMLTLRPSGVPAYDTLRGTEGWSDAAVEYITGSSTGEPSGGGERESVLFALPTGGKWRGGGLLAGRTKAVLQQGGSAMSGIVEGISSKARIVGTAALGDHALCAVNFKATSRVYLVDISGPPTLLEEIEFDRKIRRTLLTEEGIIVATRDDRCRYISLDGMKQRRNVKIGGHVRDLFLDGDQLFVIGEEELSTYSASSSDPLRLIERRSISKTDRRFIGIETDVIYMVHESGDTGRDTLVVYERGSLEEMARMNLPASAGFTEVGKNDLLLHLEGGALLRIVFDKGLREFETGIIGHLPFEVALVERGKGGFTVLGRDGTLVFGDIVPTLMREYVTAVPVVVKPPGITPSRSRSRR